MLQIWGRAAAAVGEAARRSRNVICVGSCLKVASSEPPQAQNEPKTNYKFQYNCCHVLVEKLVVAVAQVPRFEIFRAACFTTTVSFRFLEVSFRAIGQQLVPPKFWSGLRAWNCNGFSM